MDVIGAWDRERKHWRYFPFAGGLYDQARVNPFTWDLWQYILLKMYEIIGENGNAGNDATD